MDEVFNDERTQIGFLTYDSQLHFYDFKKNFNILICEENPLPYNLLFNVKENKNKIIDLLNNFNNIWDGNQDNGSNFT